jgi:hypothetical protein
LHKSAYFRLSLVQKAIPSQIESHISSICRMIIAIIA